METNSLAEKSVEAADHIIVKRKALKPVLFSLLLVIVGGGCLFAAAAIGDKTSSAYLGLVSLGWAGVAVGIIKIALGCNQKVYKPTGSPLCAHEIYFSSAGLAPLVQALENKGFEQIRKIAEQEGKNARLDLLISKDGRFISAQLFEYIPYNYQPASSVYRFTDDEAGSFHKAVAALLTDE